MLAVGVAALATDVPDYWANHPPAKGPSYWVPYCIAGPANITQNARSSDEVQLRLTSLPRSKRDACKTTNFLTTLNPKEKCYEKTGRLTSIPQEFASQIVMAEGLPFPRNSHPKLSWHCGGIPTIKNNSNMDKTPAREPLLLAEITTTIIINVPYHVSMRKDATSLMKELFNPFFFYTPTESSKNTLELKRKG